MKAFPTAWRRPQTLIRSRNDGSGTKRRHFFSEPERHVAQQQADAAVTPGASVFLSNSSTTPSRRPLGLSYGSVRKDWRGYVEQLASFPALQSVALEAASFFTQPNELEFGLPRTFHTKYEFGEKLGEGAFGQVFCVLPLQQEAHRSELQLDLAVKVVPKARVVSRKDYAALKQEGRMMVLLGGTLNVVHFFGAYEDDVNVYLVMERCMGGDASARLYSEQELHHTSNPRQEALTKMYMRDIFHVVWQCHLLRILHRDLKLENFLFADKKDDSPLKLTDFGGASFLPEDGVFLHEVHGTPLYTAPEVLQHKYAFPSDLWSCGVILYRLLSGRFPFEAGALLDERILHEPIDLETAPWPGISQDAKDLVRQLLERDVSRRLTAEQALKHPWLDPSAPLTSGASTMASAAAKEAAKGVTGPALNGTLVQRLQLYRTLNSLQQAVLNEVTRLLPLSTKQDAVVLFSEVSQDGSTSVGLEEFATYVAEGGYRLTRGEAKGFLSDLDLDGDGLLSLDEFCAALLDWAQLQSREQEEFAKCVNRVFERLDADQDGRLSVKDLDALTPFQRDVKHAHSFRNNLERCFQFADRSGSGSIDRLAFQNMLRIPAGAYGHFAKRLALY
ncbi:hypothetical protein BBJ28_00023919 [Nothophytophthora sp. Chile5]|nr:hypothetical protein BBJ28_00023919 [Nothophytophthora sp. Chile5]